TVLNTRHAILRPHARHLRRRTTDQEDPLLKSRSLTLLALSLGLALSACKPTPSAETTAAATPPAAPVTATAADTTAAQCPHADFNAFLTYFSNDIALQEKSV